MSTGGVVGAWDVDREENDVVDVNVVRASGVDRDFDNQQTMAQHHGVKMRLREGDERGEARHDNNRRRRDAITNR